MNKFYPVRQSRRPGTALNRRSHLKEFWYPKPKEEIRLDRIIKTNGSGLNNITKSDIGNKTTRLKSAFKRPCSPKAKLSARNKGINNKYKKCFRMLKLVDLYLNSNLSKSVFHKKVSKKNSRKKKICRKSRNKTSRNHYLVKSYPQKELRKNKSKTSLNGVLQAGIDPLSLLEVVTHE
ncbi:unnamed protein product [Moneuplotes crassus]|uniref:Uncharacterized protein n=1 Tax=Euplotes crassus TaxID=5936 RepID=A0AAD2D6F6_EUPCR|nr:unnamed protein product [Moneuplotes crassus]